MTHGSFEQIVKYTKADYLFGGCFAQIKLIDLEPEKAMARLNFEIKPDIFLFRKRSCGW